MLAEIFIRGLGVANVELDGLANPDQVVDLDDADSSAPIRLRTRKSPLQRLLILVDDPPDVQPVLDPPLVVVGELRMISRKASRAGRRPSSRITLFSVE